MFKNGKTKDFQEAPMELQARAFYISGSGFRISAAFRIRPPCWYFSSKQRLQQMETHITLCSSTVNMPLVV